jgi:uncharacterized membrane protein
MKNYCHKCNTVAFNPYICRIKLKLIPMKKHIIAFACIVLSASFILGSCKKEDTEKPTVKISSPTNNKEYHPGETITVIADISDNEELSQYKLEIHFDDGHGHKSTMHGDEGWEFEEIVKISGKAYSLNRSVKIPNDVKEGKYHVVVECTDKAGNEAAPASVDIKIEDH